MLKNILFRIATPIACALSVAFAPIEVSAANCYGCPSTCCDDHCHNGRGWWRDAAIFIGAAAIGAVAGVAAANSNKHRGKRGPIGPQGVQGVPGTPGTPGAGFTAATVPAGQPNAGAPITSLVFTFTSNIPLTGGFQSYVTTPDGRTFLGTTFSGTTSTVTIPSGPFLFGQFDVGIIAPSNVAIPSALVTATITNINGAATSPALDSAGIIVPVEVATPGDKFFNTTYTFPEVP